MIVAPHLTARLAAYFSLFALLAIASPAGAAAEPAQSAYRLGIFPYVAPRQIVEFYGPVAASMQAALSRPVTLESAPTFPDFSQKLAEQAYDIALIQPFDYPQVVEKRGYIPLAQLSTKLVSQLYVRDDSRYRKIEDLRGTIVAMPPAEAATTRMSLRTLHDHKLVPGRDVEVRFFNSHDSCIQQVWTGGASACGTASPRILTFEERMHAKLRAIHDSPPIPHIVFVAHPRVPAEDRARLQALITGWGQNEPGRTLLKRLDYPEFVVHRPGEYAMMRNFDPLAGTPTAAKESLFGVFPYLPARQLAQQFAPVLAAINDASGMSMQLGTSASFASFGHAVKSARYDIIYIQPFDYALAVDSGYLPLAGMEARLQASFFVPETSPDRRLVDLKGKTIAMPPAEAAVSRLARAALLQAGLDPAHDVAITHTGNHDGCVQAVKRGMAAACATTSATLQLLPKELGQGLRAVGQTASIPGTLFMGHRRLSAAARERLQAAFLGWKNDAAGVMLLKTIGGVGLIPVNVSEYLRLQEIGRDL